MKKFIKENKNLFFYLSIFLIFIILFSLAVFTGDDWGKGSAGIVQAFKLSVSTWKTYNGRLLGNFLVILLKYNKCFRVILEASMLTGIVYFCSNIFKTKNKINTIILVLLMIFMMPIEMFRESISWMSGFANFTPPVFFITWFLYLIRDLFTDKQKIVFSNYKLILVAICAICASLFCEHTSIFCVSLAISLLVYSYITKKKIYKFEIVFLIFSIVGCATVFLSPSYTHLPRLAQAWEFNNMNIVEKIIYNLKNSSFMEDMIFNNVVVNGLISFMFILNFKKYKQFLPKILILILSFMSFIIFPLIYFEKVKLFGNTIIQIGLSIIYVLIILYLIYKSFYKDDKKIYLNLLFMFLVSFICAIPLLCAYGIGPRCFFCSYLFLVLFVILLSIKLLNIDKKLCSIIYLGFRLLLGLAVVIYVYMFYSNYSINNMRENIIKTSLEENKEEIILPNYKYYFIIHQGTNLSYNKHYYDLYKRYNKIPYDVDVKFVSVNKIK